LGTRFPHLTKTLHRYGMPVEWVDWEEGTKCYGVRGLLAEPLRHHPAFDHFTPLSRPGPNFIKPFTPVISEFL